MKWSSTLDLSFQYLIVFHQIDTVNLLFSFSNYQACNLQAFFIFSGIPSGCQTVLSGLIWVQTVKQGISVDDKSRGKIQTFMPLHGNTGESAD